ncbi:MAG: amino acid permease [Cyanobacteria bacterium P01_H01_bin.74]
MTQQNSSANQSSAMRTKSIEQILSEAENRQDGLKRVLNAVDLTAIGVGAIIGAGIFVLTGTAARDAAGPSIMLSYVFAGISCILAALCYAEFATRLPISGSAYTYAYASIGEVFAWIIGWDLILEYTIGASTVSIGWTHYLSEFLSGFGIVLPSWLLGMPIMGFNVNIAALALITALTTLLCTGIKESARFNSVMVLIKLFVVLFVIFAGIPWVAPENWQPFFPFGVQGVFSGAALIFFAYIGFDAVSTAAEEVQNPQKNLPIGIIASLSICTVLYVAVSAVITGMIPFSQIDAGAPLAAAFGTVGNTLAQKLVGLGGFVGLTTVVLVLLMSQPRIYFAMARDGLLLPWFSKVHPKFNTPFNASIVTGIVAIVMAATFPMEELHHMVSIGTLFAFIVVSASVLIMRYKDDNAPTKSMAVVLQLCIGLLLLCFGIVYNFSQPFLFLGQSYHWLPVMQFPLNLPFGIVLPLAQLAVFKIAGLLCVYPLWFLFTQKSHNIPSAFVCPGVPLVPMIAIAANFYMMVNLNLDAWLRLWVWLLLGMVIYILYGYKKSKLSKG